MMHIKKTAFLIAVGLLLTARDIQPTAVYAADGTPAVHKIGIVRLGKVFEDYERTKSSTAQLEALSNSKQAQREKQVAEIRGMRDELALLNDESRVERQKAIEEKLKDLAQFDQEVKNNLVKKRETSLKEILDEIEQTVSQYSKERGFDLILSDRAVLYSIDAIDVTGDIVTVLNTRYAAKKKS